MTIDPITIPCPFCEEIIVERSADTKKAQPPHTTQKNAWSFTTFPCAVPHWNERM